MAMGFCFLALSSGHVQKRMCLFCFALPNANRFLGHSPHAASRTIVHPENHMHICICNCFCFWFCYCIWICHRFWMLLLGQGNRLTVSVHHSWRRVIPKTFLCNGALPTRLQRKELQSNRSTYKYLRGDLRGGESSAQKCKSSVTGAVITFHCHNFLCKYPVAALRIY